MKIIKVISLIGFLIFNILFNVFQEKETIETSTDLSIGVVDLPSDLVYLSEDDYTSNILIGNLFEGLVNLSSSGDVVSGIAERYTVSSDGLEYRFYLRNDAYLSSGELITSKDFFGFFRDIVEKDKNKFYYEDLKSIQGIDEFYRGEITFDEVGIDFSKKNVLIIKLKEKDDNFLKNLTKDKFSFRNNFKYLYNYKDFYEYISYSGAYKISSIYNDKNGNTKISLKPNEYYYLNNYKTVDEKVYSLAKDKEVTLEVFPTREFALESYKNGKINFVLDIAYNSLDEYFNSNEIYYVHNEDTNLILDLDKYLDEEKAESSFEVAVRLEDDKVDEEGNKIEFESSNKLDKGNFMSFILDVGDIRHINGINGSTMNSYMFNRDYFIKEFQKYTFDDNRVLKIVTHSDDNYIDIARSLKDFLYEEFSISSNIIALESDYIKENLNKDEYDILISNVVNDNDVLVFDFDKPDLILSQIPLNNENIDGNGTLVINNIN